MNQPALIREAQVTDATEILAIYAPIVEDSSISFEFETPSLAEFQERIRNVQKNHPWLVAEENQRVLGYAYAGSHRSRAAYQWSCEVSVYVAPQVQGQGVGRRLYLELLERLRTMGYRNAYAGITLPNEPSLAFHAALGFQPIGVYPRVGWKFGQWRDVAWWGIELGEKTENPAPPIA